jgi:hypothetical protein
MRAQKSHLPFTLFAMACLCLGLSGCHRRTHLPAISFTVVPVASEGGPDTLGTLSGRVTGAQPGQQIVIYAKASEIWWIQPNIDQPYTSMQPDGSWSSAIHLGDEYAAVLVGPEFQANATLTSLPPLGQNILALIKAKGTSAGNPLPVADKAKSLHFSGYDWIVRTAKNNRGGILRPYSADNAWVDPQGSLHLKVTREASGWACSEVSMVRSLGYGTYNFEVRDVGHFEPALMLDLFTWSDQNADESNHEMNMTVGRRGDPASKNAEYIVQPYYVPSNVSRFNVPAGRLTYSFDWELNSVTFQTWKEHADSPGGQRVAEHVFVSGVPPTGGEVVHINLCVFGYGKVTLQHEAEVVIDRFQYLP